MKTRTLLTGLLLLSVLSGGTGCATSRVIENTRVPEVTLEASGIVRFNGKSVEPGKLASALKANGIRGEQEIDILIPENPDRRRMQAISAELVRGGFPVIAFVKNRKATSGVPKPGKSPRK